MSAERLTTRALIEALSKFDPDSFPVVLDASTGYWHDLEGVREHRDNDDEGDDNAPVVCIGS